MKKQHVQLSETDREKLTVIVSKKSVKVSRHNRAKYLLALDSGRTYTSLKAEYKVSLPRLKRLAVRYQSSGLACLEDKPRSGRPAEFDGVQRAKLTALACSQVPEGHARWSLTLLADKAVELEYFEHLSRSHVATILKKTTSSPIANEHGALG